MRIRPLGEPGDLGWVVMAHGEVYASEFGWDTSFEALVAGIVGDHATQHDPARDAAWIAEHDDGRRAGCIFCVADPDDPTTAKLRVLLVYPDARGHDLGARLIEECISFAREAGYSRIRLWTTDALPAARHLYLKRGFRLIDEEPRRPLFGKDLAGQTYELEL
jgi:GNAT superfamily N-acetyltransferase